MCSPRVKTVIEESLNQGTSLQLFSSEGPRKSISPFPSSPGPLHQSEVKCSAFDMGMIFHSHANKTIFHKKDCALGLILKVRVFELGRGLFRAYTLPQSPRIC